MGHPEDTGPLFGTAFWKLGVSTRHDARRILEAAEEKSLTLDPAMCAALRDLLTNPRKRLKEEMRWMPGVSPKRAIELASAQRGNQRDTVVSSQLPKLASFNLGAASMASINHLVPASALEETIHSIALLGDELDADTILREINEDRAVSGFTPARKEQVQEELDLLRSECASRALDALGSLPTEQIIISVTRLAEDLSADAELPTPDMFSRLLEMYEKEAQQFLGPESEKIEALCQAVLKAAKAGEQAIEPLLRKLGDMVRRWDKVAQPIQLIAYRRGLDHASSADLGHALRSLSLDLHNDLQMSQAAQVVSQLCAEVFAELPVFGDRVQEDLDALIDIAAQRAEDAVNHAEWAKSITYEGEIGSFIRYRIAISPRGVEWKGTTFPLEKVAAVRWGGTRSNSGDNYSIVLSGDGQYMDISFGGHTDVFAAVTSRLWRAVGVRILLGMLNDLGAGKRTQIGQAAFDDVSVVLREKRAFGAGEYLRYPWTQVGHVVEDGQIWIVSYDRKAQAVVSFLHDENAHILNQALGLRREKGVSRMSEILNPK